MWQCWGLIIISITIFASCQALKDAGATGYGYRPIHIKPPSDPSIDRVPIGLFLPRPRATLDSVESHAKSCYFDSCTPNPCEQGGTCRLQPSCDYRASCQALKDAGATGYGYIYIKPPSDPSIAPVKVWCSQDNYGGGWMWLHSATTVKCVHKHLWSGDHISCSEPDNTIAAFAVTDGYFLKDTVNMWFLDSSFCQPLSINRDFAADLANCRRDASNCGLGDAGVLIEGVCSTEASWGSGTFARCGTSMDVRVKVSVHFDSSPYGTYVMACYDGSTWLNLESWDTNDNYRNVWIKN